MAAAACTCQAPGSSLAEELASVERNSLAVELALVECNSLAEELASVECKGSLPIGYYLPVLVELPTVAVVVNHCFEHLSK